MSVPVNGGPEILVSAAAQHRLWSVADNGLYFFDLIGKTPQVFSADLRVELKRLDFVTRQVDTVATIVTNRSGADARAGGRFANSPIA